MVKTVVSEASLHVKQPQTRLTYRRWGMTDLRNRGVRDILIACCDGLAGSGDAITAAFGRTVVQRCVVHYADLGIMPTWRLEPLVAALRAAERSA